MAKRTIHKIEKDYEIIRKVVNTTPVTSIMEIAKIVGLTESEVNTSLARHPRIEKKIMAQLKKNKEELKAKKKSDNEALESPKKSEKENPEVADKTVQLEETVALDLFYVIDASICGSENLQEFLSNLYQKAKIILTSVTLKELEKMQKFRDVYAVDARHILAMAAENPNVFYIVQIDETLEIADDCIIKYCADNKHKVALLTSDKTMALKARMYDVETLYLKQKKATNTNFTPPMEYQPDRKSTLFAARKAGDKLLISDFNTEFRSILLISNNILYKDGVQELNIGDDVFIATKKPDFMTFAHYQITSLSDKNHCKLIHSTRIYKSNDILGLPKAEYKSFMREFKRRHDL